MILKKLYDCASVDLKNSVVFTVTATNNQTANPNNFNPVTYAIKVDNIASFSSKIGAYLQAIKASNPSKYSSFSIEKLIREADRNLRDIYRKSSDLELTFLEQFKDFGISLYKANDTLDDWSALQTDPILFPGTVFESPCN